MNIYTIFFPSSHKRDTYQRIPRKMKKQFKKDLWGFYGVHNFHGICKAQKYCNTVFIPITEVKRRGKFIWAYSHHSKQYWRLLYSPNKGILNKPLGYANSELRYD